MTTKVRKSRQRDRILELLQQDHIHVTANDLYEQLRHEFPTLSLGNVYRNLNILVEQGLATRLGFGSTFDLYEATRAPHYHFICHRCGSIEDVEVPAKLQQSVERWIADHHGHRITDRTVEFRGICRACSRRDSS